MADQLTVDIVTPDDRVFQGNASGVRAPGIEGSFEVLANHAPMIAAFGIGNAVQSQEVGKALETTGLAQRVAEAVLGMTRGFGPVAALVVIYLATNLLTEVITNNAAAVLMVPISMATASSLGAPPIAFGLVVAVAASASFLTPIGYQTNLMVMGPGGYRFSDYARVGWPVTLLVMSITVGTLSILYF